MDMEYFTRIQNILDVNGLGVRRLNWGWALFRKANEITSEYHITTCENLEDLYKIIEEKYKD